MGADTSLAQRKSSHELVLPHTTVSLSPRKSRAKAEGFKELEPLFALLGVNSRLQQVRANLQLRLLLAGSNLKSLRRTAVSLQKMGESGVVGSLCTSASAWRDAFEEIRASHSLDSSFTKVSPAPSCCTVQSWANEQTLSKA